MSPLLEGVTVRTYDGGDCESRRGLSASRSDRGPRDASLMLDVPWLEEKTTAMIDRSGQKTSSATMQ